MPSRFPADFMPSYLANTPIGEYNKMYEHQPICMPTILNKDDSEIWLEVGDNGLRVFYNGPGIINAHAASIRANYSMPIEAGLYYFEVDIIDQGEHGYIGIGFSESYVSVNGLPGWDYKSFGYHGDDGKKFSSSGSGVPYGPLFTTGDTIGVGINFFECTSFYTKNGVHLGTAFTDVEGDLYPMIGLRSKGEIIEANFGQRPFKFNIDNYAQFIFKEVRKNEKLKQWVDRIFGDNDDNSTEEVNTVDDSLSSSDDGLSSSDDESDELE